MKLIAAAGRIQIKNLNGDIEVGATKRLHLFSLDEIVLDAPKITIRAQGAGATYGCGSILTQTSGAHTQKAVSHSMEGPGSVSPQGMLNPVKAEFDQKSGLLGMVPGNLSPIGSTACVWRMAAC